MNFPRPSASALRCEIEEGLAKRAPAALTPSVKNEPERIACGVRALDDCLHGGLPVSGITELVAGCLPFSRKAEAPPAKWRR